MSQKGRGTAGPLGAPSTRPAWTHPIGHTVRGQGVEVPSQVPLNRRTSHEATIRILTQATVPSSLARNLALIRTQLTADAVRVMGRFGGRPEGTAILAVHSGDMGA